jgi:hypothetical protein
VNQRARTVRPRLPEPVMKDANPVPKQDVPPDDLAKRLFIMTMVGVAAYVAIILMLLSSVD